MTTSKPKNINNTFPNTLTVPVLLDDGATLPTRAYFGDAGLDLYSRERAVIPPGGSYVFDTGVHIAIPAGYCGLLVSKSGLNVIEGLTSEGLIDSGYRGSIRVKLYNNDKLSTKIIEKSQKISQIVILPYLPVKLVSVGNFPSNSFDSRDDKGFGSSGV